MSELVLLCGVPSESPLALARERLEQLGIPHLVLSQREFERSPFWYEIRGDRISGEIVINGVGHPLAQVTAVYTRLMDEQLLPEMANEPVDSSRRRKARQWHEAVSNWCEIAPIRVVNRAAAMASNASKPYQAQIILRHGFQVPDTLITSDPALVGEFARQHSRVVFKSMSGVRSIVRELTADDFARLGHIRLCPVQFQAYVPGRNVRVHTIGTEVFATSVTTDAVDYRYAARQSGVPAELEAMDLSDELAERCVALAADLGLAFAGIDLKITDEGGVFCFEVNPSPAYSYYELHTGQPLAAALARYLAGMTT